MYSDRLASLCRKSDPSMNSPARRGFPPLPFEVVLNIIDALISQAEHSAKPIDFCFYLSPTPRLDSKIDVQISDRYMNPMWSADKTKNRFRQLRLALQLSTKTRAMVLRRFRRIQIWDWTIQNTSLAWAYSKTDRFRPLFGRIPEDCLRLRQALLQPTAQDSILVPCLVNIHGMPKGFLNDEYDRDMDTLFSLPNLREITLDSRMHCICSNRFELPEDDHPHPSDEVITVDPLLFPSLGYWVERQGQALEKFCRRAQEKGVHVFVGADGNADMRKLKLVLTDEGVGCILIDPICTCDL